MVRGRVGFSAGDIVEHRVRLLGLFRHSGCSSTIAHLPENTLASYRAAILEGAEGIESGTSFPDDILCGR